MSPRLALALLALAACKKDGPPEFVAPLDGQTGVPVDQPLLVRGGGVEIPDGYPVGDVIRVVDLDDGGFIAGTAVAAKGDLLFTPDGGAFPRGHRFAWTVDRAPHGTHGPTLPVPEHLQGTAAFYTSPAVQLLAAGLDDDGQACVVLSRPADGLDLTNVRVTADDVELPGATMTVLSRDLWDPGYELLPEDPSVDVTCVDTAVPLAAGANLRVWWGNQGPWLLTISADPLSDLVIALRRGP